MKPLRTIALAALLFGAGTGFGQHRSIESPYSDFLVKNPPSCETLRADTLNSQLRDYLQAAIKSQIRDNLHGMVTNLHPAQTEQPEPSNIRQLVKEYLRVYEHIDKTNNWAAYRTGDLHLPKPLSQSLGMMEQFFGIDNQSFLTGLAARVREGMISRNDLPATIKRYLLEEPRKGLAREFSEVANYFSRKDTKTHEIWERLEVTK